MIYGYYHYKCIDRDKKIAKVILYTYASFVIFVFGFVMGSLFT